MKTIPFFNPGERYRRMKKEFDAAFFDCMEKGDLIARSQLSSFEDHFARWIGTRHAIGVNSGYDALAMALRAEGIGPGDEVVLPGHTFVACVSSIVNLGAVPVLVDIGEDHNMDMDRVGEALTPRTRAVMPVHLNGRMCEMDRLMALAEEHHLAIVEDVAQAVGARFRGRKAGTFGRAGCFSFYPIKILGGFGDGGAVTTDDSDLARQIRLLRYNGEDEKTGEYHCHGYTALLDNVQAALLEVQLPRLEEWIEHRRLLASRYIEGLKGVGDLTLPSFEDDRYFDVYQYFAVTTKRRLDLRKFLHEHGIKTLLMWKKPMWHHEGLGLGKQDLPRCEALYEEMLYLPISPEHSLGDVDHVVETTRAFFAG